MLKTGANSLNAKTLTCAFCLAEMVDSNCAICSTLYFNVRHTVNMELKFTIKHSPICFMCLFSYMKDDPIYASYATWPIKDIYVVPISEFLEKVNYFNGIKS